MTDSNNEAVKEASKKIDGTIIQLKAWLEDIVQMRVECAKLEFNTLSLYHTICPEVLDGVREDRLNVNNNTRDSSDRDNGVQ